MLRDLIPFMSFLKTRVKTFMNDQESFIKAYHEFKESVDFAKSGILPDEENLVWYMLMGVPHVPADDVHSEDAPVDAIEQRVNILKAVFVELNRKQTDDFINQGLIIYDQAGKKAKMLLKETTSEKKIEKD